MHKLKSQNQLFDPNKKIGDLSGGGYVKEIHMTATLCDVCYTWFFPNDKGEGIDATTVPEIQAIFDSKRRRALK